MMRLWMAALLMTLHQISVAKECTSPGKFQNDQIGGCENYTLCLIAGGQNYWQFNLTCPGGFIFNHLYTRCTNDTNYQCVPHFECSEAGNFTNPYNDNCTSYIACVPGLTDVMTARSVSCPSDNIFDPTENSCVNLNETAHKCVKEKPSSFGDVFINLLESHESINDCVRLQPNQVVFVYIVIYLLVSNFIRV